MALPLSSLRECATCEQRRCQGGCVCGVDGVCVALHVRAGYCPHPAGPRFGDGAAPADWPPAQPVVMEAAETPAEPVSRVEIEHRRATCAACPERVELADGAARCRLKGGGRRTCARCWAVFSRGAEQCPAGKWIKDRSPLDG